MSTAMQPGEPASASRQNRILGMTGQGAGVVGLVVCLLLMIAVIFARGWALNTVSGIETRVDTALAKGIPLVDAASSKVDDVATKVTSVKDAANAVSAAAGPATALLEKLTGEVNGLSQRYLDLRNSYTEARNSVFSALDRLNTLDAIVPFISIPQGPVDTLHDLDAKITELDASVMEVLNANPGSGALGAVATTLAEKATGLETKLTALSAGLTEAKSRIGSLRTEVASTADTVTTAITLVSILMILGLIYLAAVHVVLYRSGKALGRTKDG